MLLANSVSAQPSDSAAKAMDSVEISLLTCNPRQNVYSLYGHTAIRFTDRTRGIDLAVNYGMFSFSKPFFVLRFVFGLTDYEMGIEDFEEFRQQYESYGCGVRQQVLNLTVKEKAAIAAAIQENYEPQNRVYRYNYFYDNCTTRARDILLKNITGTVRYASEKRSYPSYREMVHSYNADHPWARFGNDLLLGIKADMPTRHAQQQFLPDNLRKDFDNAAIVSPDGSKRPLVSKSFWVVKPVAQPLKKEFPLTPTQCALLFAAMTVALTVYEYTKKKNYWGYDAALLAADGTCGLILFAMVFSEHPTVSLNFQILALNPLSLVFIYPTVKKLKMHAINIWLKAWGVMLVAFFFAGIFQTYAEGMYIVASSLLIRYLLKSVQFARIKETERK